MEAHRQIGPEYLDLAMDIYRCATSRMDEQNIPQWDEVYPDRAAIERDIAEGSLYGLFIHGLLHAVQVMNEKQDESYSAMPWRYPDERPLVLHRLCVDPAFQNAGVGRRMVRYAEEFAEANGYRTIRFDAFVDNPISVGIYRKMGFSDCGIVRFRKGDFYCFEKKTSHY